MAANKKETVTDQFELAVTDLASVFGPGDQLVRELESIFAELRISARGNKIKLEGSSVAVATSRRAIDELATMVANGRIPTAEDVNRVVAMLKTNSGAKAAEVLSQSILSSRGKTIRPKTEGQKTYVDAIDQHTSVFVIGPA